MMKMSDTKPGDFIKWKHDAYGEIITLVIPDKYNGPKPGDIKLVIVQTYFERFDPETFYFDHIQYNTIFKNYDVTLLKLGVKDENV